MLTSRRHSAHGPQRRPRRRVGRAHAARLMAAAVVLPVLTFALVVGQLSGAVAAESPVPEPSETATRSAAPTESVSPTPSPSPSAAPVVPSITAPAADAFVGGSTTVTGSRGPGQEIQLLSPTGGDPLCIIRADGTDTWQCPGVLLPSGPAVSLRVVVTGEPSLAASHTVRVLQAPTVTGGATGPSSNGLVRGTGYPGATVTATLGSGQRCSFTVDASGAWACLMQGALVSGPAQITASQQTSFSAPDSSPASEPAALIFDIDAPAAPVVLSPAAGATVPNTSGPYSGQGENGATVTVFAGAYSVCSAVVSGGIWSCTGSGVATGSYDVRAVQQDAAGNVSAGSPAVRVRFGLPAVTATPTPTPAAVPPVTPSPTATPAPTPTPSARPTAPGVDPNPTAAGPVALTVPGSWNDPTQFSTAVIAPWTVAQFPWLQAAALALGALALIVVPARLLAGTVTRARDGRPVFRARRVAGRNRAREEFDVAPTLPVHRGVAYAAGIVLAAVFVVLSGPVSGTPAYLRLLLAVALALVVVNAVAALVPQWWGSRALRLEVSTTILPRYLAVIAVTALASRFLDLHPALLFGLLGSVGVQSGAAGTERGRLAAVRAGSLLGLGLAALVVVGTLPVADSFLSALAAEFANTVVLASIGSAVLVLIPIGSTSGRSILAWSPPVWAALAAPSFLALFVLLSPMLPGWEGDGTVVLLGLASAAFACVSVAAWAWQRFVLPALH